MSRTNKKFFDTQCDVATYVKRDIMVQPLPLRNGTSVTMTTQVVNENGVCKLVNISLSGC